MPENSGIFYTDQGKGFPVLLIHGFCETHEIWDSFSNRLSDNYRLICIDLPGFGRSKLLPNGFSLADVASKIIVLLEELKIEACISIGHSLGGYVSLAVAEQRPAILKAFGLFHSTAYADTAERRVSRNKVIEFVSNRGVTPFIESFIPPLFYNQSNPYIQSIVRLGSQTNRDTLLAYVMAMRDRPDSTFVVAHFEGAILFIAGEWDAGIAVESIKKQSEMAIRPTVCVLTNTAHMGMFEQPDEAIKYIQVFLQSEIRN